MSSFEKVVIQLEEQNERCNSFIEGLVEFVKENNKWFLDFEKDCKTLVEGSQSQFKATFLSTFAPKTPKTRPRRGRKRLSPETSQESQENQNSTCEINNDFKRPRTSDKSENADQEVCREPRTKRNASKKATEQISRNLSMRLNQKLRRNENGDLELGSIVIKQEKIDTVSSSEKMSVLKDITNTETVEITENSQKEVDKYSSGKEKESNASSSSESTQFCNNSEMPPPAKLPPKKHTKPTELSKHSESDDDNTKLIKKHSTDKNNIANIKKEKDDSESMPPPLRITRTARKGKKDLATLPVTKSKRTKAKKNQQDDDSLEVQLIQPKISTVELFDSDDDVPLVHRFKDNQFLAVKIKKERISKEISNHSGNSADENTEDKSLSEASEKTKTTSRSRSLIKNKENGRNKYFDNEKSAREAYEKSRPSKRSRSANDAANEKNLEINHNTETLTKLTKSVVGSLSNGGNESPNIMNKTVTMSNANQFQSSTPAAISESTDNANKTFVLSQVSTSVKPTASPLITDDDSDGIVKTPKKMNIKSRPPIHSKITTKSPQLFSPYANNPVKNRVAAFERIGNAELTNSDVNRPARMTRTKTKALKEAAENADSDKSEDARSLKSSKAEVSSKNVTKNNSRGNLTSSIESLSSNKGVKASRTDIREKREADQKRKLEKEEESQKKKEALLLAKIEEQKRKREEKLQRAQLQREAKEKEKQLLYEKSEKEKEERNKRLLAERDERLKEEIQRKRALAAQRAAETEERRKAEEAARLAKLKEQEEAEKIAEAQRKKELEEAEKLHQRRLAEERAAEQARQKARAQMQAALQAKKIQKIKNSNTPVKAPKLPVTTPLSAIQKNYTTPLSATQKNFTKPTPSNLLEALNSDDSTDDEEDPKIQLPPWSQKIQRNQTLLKQAHLPSKMKKGLFNTCCTTVNLREIFEDIDERLLRRNSSAVWRTPPRFSQMTKF